MLTTETLKKFGKLADLLKKAGRLGREISQEKVQAFVTDIPKLEKLKQVPKGQEWFWSKEWQQGEKEVNEALVKGEYEIFESVDGLVNDLHAHV